GGSELLALVQYDPATETAYAISSSTLTALDTTNLRAVFNAPASGRVIVRLSATCRAATSGSNTALAWGLLEGATTVPGTVKRVNSQVVAQMKPFYTAVVDGLTPSQEYTWDWAQVRQAG